MSSQAAGSTGIRRLPGWVLLAAAATAALLLGSMQGAVGALLIALLLGLLLRNVGLVRPGLRPGVQRATKPLLRLGIVVLGLQLAVPEILALGVPVLVLIGATVLIGFVFTHWFARRIGMSPAASLLYAAGFSICGASAVAGVQSVVDAEDDEVASAVAMVTLYGTVALLALPLVSGMLGLTQEQSGVWIGLTVHEVAQVVAAGGMVGAAALATAAVVKLGRVVLLAPVLTFSALFWRRAARDLSADDRGAGEGWTARDADAGSPPKVPLVPLFVLGFLAMVAVRSVVPLPEELLDAASLVATWLLAGAMFGLGVGIDLKSLARTGGRGTVVGGVSTAVMGAGTLAAVLLLV